MSPEHARIFLLDDDPLSRKTKTEILERAGHTVVLQAGTREEARQALSQFKKRRVTVAVLDNNLDSTDPNNRDGDLIGRTIRNKHPTVLVIGNSNYPLKSAHLQNLSRDGFTLAKLVTEA